MEKKQWIKRFSDLELSKLLSKELNISLLLASMMASRKIANKQALSFLNPELKNLKEPKLFADMQKAILRISKAIGASEIIGIFGDYDVDGVCSTAILEHFFTSINAKGVATLPNRMIEGYGLSKAGIDRLFKQGANLLITVDCGILAHEQVDYANSLGLEVIIIDHHTVGESLPKALAVINPKR